MLFFGAQVAAILGMSLKYTEAAGIQWRQCAEPPARRPLWSYLLSSLTTAVMLGFGLLWAAGVNHMYIFRLCQFTLHCLTPYSFSGIVVLYGYCTVDVSSAPLLERQCNMLTGAGEC